MKEQKQRDLSQLHKRIEAGDIGPGYQRIFADVFNREKYESVTPTGLRKVWVGSIVKAVQSVFLMLARKTQCDADAMRAEFKLTALCADWEEMHGNDLALPRN